MPPVPPPVPTPMTHLSLTAASLPLHPDLWLGQQKVCGNPHYVLPSRSPTSNTSPPPPSPSPPPPLSLNLLHSSFLFIVLRTAFLRTRRLVLLAYFLHCTSSSPSSPSSPSPPSSPPSSSSSTRLRWFLLSRCSLTAAIITATVARTATGSKRA